jgi:hypothetical protein
VSTIIDIANAVVGELNAPASPLAGQATAQRAYRPVFDLQDMKDLHVTVVPRGVDMSSASRSLVQSDVQIDIGVQKKLAGGEQTAIDSLMAIVEQVADYLRGRKLAAAPEVSWVKTENNPIFAPEHLEQFGQFTSVLTLTFRSMR